MRVDVDLINGVMLGLEWGEDEDGDTVIVIDFFILRFIIG